MEKKGLIVYLILIGIIAFWMIDNYIIFSKDLAPFFGDEGGYIGASFKVYLLLYQHKFFDALTIPQAGNPGYPGLFIGLSSLFYWLFGLNQKSALMTNFIFIVILIFSVYGLGKLLHSRRAGVLAAFIVMSFPGVFALSRTYSFDFASIAMVALSIYCLLKTEEFTRRMFSVFLGLVVGLGMVIRPSFVIFFLGPFCYYSFISFRDAENKQILFKKIKNFIVFLVVGLFLVGFFYFHIISRTIGYQIVCMSGLQENWERFSLENVLAYFKGAFGIQMLYFYFALFLFSAVLFFKGNNKHKVMLFLWFLIPYLFFTFYIVTKKVLRFTAPYLPVMALIISIFLWDIKKTAYRKVLIFLTVFLGLSQLILISHIPVSNVIIDSLNANTFHLHPLWSDYFNAPALKTVGVGGRPHAYSTDYGIGALADSLMESELIAKEKEVIFVFVEFVNEYGIAVPLQYIMCQKSINFSKTEFQYQIGQYTVWSGSPISSYVDLLITTPSRVNNLSRLDFNHSKIKFINLENNKTFSWCEL